MPMAQLHSSDRVWDTFLRPGSAPAALFSVLDSFGGIIFYGQHGAGATAAGLVLV